jgi:hypothetical protein
MNLNAPNPMEMWMAEWWDNTQSNQNQLINNYISQENRAANTPTTLWVNV